MRSSSTCETFCRAACAAALNPPGPDPTIAILYGSGTASHLPFALQPRGTKRQAPSYSSGQSCPEVRITVCSVKGPGGPFPERILQSCRLNSNGYSRMQGKPWIPVRPRRVIHRLNAGANDINRDGRVPRYAEATAEHRLAWFRNGRSRPHTPHRDRRRCRHCSILGWVWSAGSRLTGADG